MRLGEIVPEGDHVLSFVPINEDVRLSQQTGTGATFYFDDAERIAFKSYEINLFMTESVVLGNNDESCLYELIRNDAFE